MLEANFITLLVVMTIQFHGSCLGSKIQIPIGTTGVITPCELSQVFVGGKCFTACTGGYIDEQNICVQYKQPTCPSGHVFINGFCFPANQLPAQTCPEGYYLANNLCYRIVPLPCEGDATTANPVIEPGAQLTTEPAAAATTEAIIKPTTEITIEITTAPSTELTTEPITETTTEPTAETSSEATTVTTTEAGTKTTSEATTEPISTPTTVSTIAPTTEPTTAPTTPLSTTPLATLPTSPPASIYRCPPGSIQEHGHCRKVYCPQGEYYSGRCLQPICPEGTVWHGKRCQPPSYVTTILEIDNVFTHSGSSKPGQIVRKNENNVYYYTTSTNAPLDDPCASGEASVKPMTTTAKPYIKTTVKPYFTTPSTTTIRTPTSAPPTNNTETAGCCSIVTPRICKRYGAKWVCFNRRYTRCDPELCHHPIIYLKVTDIVYDPPVLIMPPNPPLQACAVEGCDVDSSVDCSGCAQNLRDSCSPYCYRYMCPYHGCAYIDQQKYCSRYPGEPGCTKQDGCIWDWCGEKCD